MTRLYLIRHAEAEGNIYRRMDGHYNSRITQNGLRQIDALRQRFAEIPIDAVYASDLFRTRKTAEAICVPKGLPLRTDPRLREVLVGIWENVPFGELERRWPAELACYSRSPENWHIAGAESYEQYAGRFCEALTEIAEAHPGQSVAVFTHGCVLSGGLHRLIGLPHDASISDNTAVSLLEYENGVFSPVFLFDNSHLSEAISTRARQRWWKKQGGKFNLHYRAAGPEDAALYDPAWGPGPGDRVWIALLEDEAVGYVSVTKTGPSALWLRPEYRHRRFGDQLLGQAVVRLRAEGIEVLNIGIPTANPEALAFFARHCGNPVQMDDVYTVYRMEIGVK
ncbi:MAG: GNAT family N-acetyltransferase [Oscillospiraceae bacterium]|nr:GNAT family N-acetyltransferase [Oscillospiraceae bacterium]